MIMLALLIIIMGRLFNGTRIRMENLVGWWSHRLHQISHGMSFYVVRNFVLASAPPFLCLLFFNVQKTYAEYTKLAVSTPTANAINFTERIALFEASQRIKNKCFMVNAMELVALDPHSWLTIVDSPDIKSHNIYNEPQTQVPSKKKKKHE